MLAGLVPVSPASSAREPEQVARITIVRVTPTPSPTPRPQPTPTFNRPAVSPAPRVRAAVHRAGPPPPRRAVATTQPVAPAAQATAQGAGVAGEGPGAGSTGADASGNGNAGSEPCGAVTFSNPHGSHYDPATHGFFVDVRMTVEYPDGHRESTILDYPFYYPDEASNPWSERNLSNPDFPMLLQTPPPEKAAGEPALVAYVVAHSAQGRTLLKDCP